VTLGDEAHQERSADRGLDLEASRSGGAQRGSARSREQEIARNRRHDLDLERPGRLALLLGLRLRRARQLGPSRSTEGQRVLATRNERERLGKRAAILAPGDHEHVSGGELALDRPSDVDFRRQSPAVGVEQGQRDAARLVPLRADRDRPAGQR